MKLLAIIISCIVFISLVIDVADFNEEKTNKPNRLTNTAFVNPAKLENSQLEVEKHWRKLKALRNIKVVDTNVTHDKAQNILSIGNEKFTLYGIFSESETPFILLKGIDNKSVKLSKGDTLNEQYTLTEVKHNTIAFNHENERIEFKLFKRN